MKRHRADHNQQQIVADLREMGFSVDPNHDDLLVGKNGLNLWCEIKDPKRMNHKGALQPKQIDRLKTWRGAYIIAYCTEDVVRWFRENQLLRVKGD